MSDNEGPGGLGAGGGADDLSLPKATVAKLVQGESRGTDLVYLSACSRGAEV